MRRVGPYIIEIEKAPPMRVAARIYAGPGVPVEDEAVAQLVNAATLPVVNTAVATPDIHVGYGAPIGAVLGMDDAVIPSAVGYDINCGMRLLATPLDAGEIPLQAVVRGIQSAIPLGEGKQNAAFRGDDLRRILAKGVAGLLDVAAGRRFAREHPDLADGLDLEIEESAAERIEDRGSMDGDPDALTPRAIERGAAQFATLGGGNHFIEVQRVTDVWDEALAAAWGIRPGQAVIMIHSGSRGLGHETGGHFMRVSAEYDRRGGLEHPNRDLAWLPTSSDEGRAYLGAMRAAANFAFVNRHLMAMLVRRALRNATGATCVTVYDVAHNIARVERHLGRDVVVHRKGATRAFTGDRMSGTPHEHTGQPVLIPGSMGTASYLLAGDPRNAETLCSVNHGAGRVMSRSAASGRKRHRKGAAQGRAEAAVDRGTRRGGGGLVTEEQFQESMKGIMLVAEDRRGVREEAPAAYKDIEAVIATVTGAGLARAVARMRPLAVLKG